MMCGPCDVCIEVGTRTTGARLCLYPCHVVYGRTCVVLLKLIKYVWLCQFLTDEIARLADFYRYFISSP